MLKKLSLIALILIVAPALAAAPVAVAQDNMATVHGTFYDLWTFEPLENVVLEVYSGSTLQQQTLFPTSTYSLTLHPGSYTIDAKYYKGNQLLYDAEENITLGPNDNLTLDIIMFPTFDENEYDENYYAPVDDVEEAEARTWWGVGIALGVVIVGAGVFYLSKMRKKPPAAPPAEAPPRVESPQVKVVGLPDDLREVMDAITESGGRINQVELRQKLPYSEAKVSLMVADLENRGLVRKIKKGRGNIIILKE